MAACRITLTVDGRSVIVSESETVEQLHENVGRMNNANIDSFYLTYGGQVLDIARDGGKLLKEYHFHNMETLLFTQRSSGGSKLQALEGHVQLTKEQCCVTLEDDQGEWRAKLTCGHAISVSAVQRMLDVTLQDGGYKFYCPSCRAPMEWFVVRHILSSVMSDQELLTRLDNINKNVQGQPEMRKCTSCGTNQQRDFTKKWYSDRNRVACDECTRRAGQEISFCWYCRKSWRPGFKGCGNSKCDGQAAKLKELKECSMKKIASVAECPNTRACPRCGTLIYHVDYCKHMTCKCGCSFCFVCMQLQNSDESWPCGDAYGQCPVAPRQTSIRD